MPSASDFDAAWYLQQNPDVAAAGINPLTHFQQYGILENRAPNQTIYDAATGRGGAPAYGDSYNFNMNSGVGGLLNPYGADYLAARPDVVEAIRRGEFTSAVDHYQKFGQKEGTAWVDPWSTSTYAALDPKSGAATFGGPSYANTLKTADAVSGYTGGAMNGRPANAGGTATGGAYGMLPGGQQAKPASPFGDFDMNGFMSGIQKQMQDWQTQQSNSWNTFKSEMDQKGTYGGVFGNQPGQTTSPTYSPQSKNGFGVGWGGSNPFKIGSF